MFFVIFRAPKKAWKKDMKKGRHYDGSGGMRGATGGLLGGQKQARLEPRIQHAPAPLQAGGGRIEYPFGGSTARPPFCNVPVRPYRSPKWVPIFSENWHVRFEGIVRPGIILLPFGVELEARGCHFLDFPTPGPSRKQNCKKNKKNTKKTPFVGSNIGTFFVIFVIGCCSFFVSFWR